MIAIKTETCTPRQQDRKAGPQLAARPVQGARVALRFPASPAAALLAVAFLAASVLFQQPGALAASSPDKLNYQTSPIMSAGKTVPRVLLVLSKDHKLFQQAYNELTDMDADGKIDTGFNPSALYYGYFDSKSCYAYSGTPAYAASNTGYFYRSGPAKEDQSQATLDSNRPQAVKDAGIKAARAAHYATGETIGICNDPHTSQSGLYSGNWLNYVTATRMDVIRRILYGGYRMTDENFKNGKSGRTVLQSSMVPRDGHVWGTDVVADNRWATETAMTKYYDISKYTPFPKPSSGAAHFFARTRNNTNATPFPVVEYILNAVKGTFKTNINVSGTGGRYYDWVYNDAPNPSSANLQNPSGVIKTFTVHVEVCTQGNTAEGEGCRSYPNGNLKPVGLLQQNGENAQMLFGLLTGSYTYSSAANAESTTGANTRRKGGVVRNHITDLSQALDLETGLFKTGGIIRNIDSLTIAGNPTPTATAYTSAMSWGNPTGEMLYEAVRFLARHAEGPTGTTQPTSAFLPSSAETTYNSSNQAPYLKNWTTLPTVPAADCAKPVILLIAEADSDYDGDTAVNSTGGINRPLLEGLPPALSTALPSSFKMSTYLDKITAVENLATSSSKRNYFYANDALSDCSAKPLTSLTQVKGLCPFLPSYEGTYSSAAVAYYGHTHNFGVPGSSEQSLDVYAVTMSGAFPSLEFPVFSSSGAVAKKITIIPGAMSSRDAATTSNRILGMLNYFILDWQTDSRGTPYHVKVRVNFEDAAQAHDAGYGASDWDSDLLVEFTIDLVSATKTSNTNGETFTTSGTAKIAGALKVKGGTYYAFTTPYNGNFVIEPSNVAGLVIASWKYMNSAGVRMMGGYTISGSTRDGTYMDVGHNGGEAKYATPYTCNWPAGYGGATANNGTGCKVAYGNSPGMSIGDNISFKIWRTFEFSDNASAAGEYLKGPLWLAAKYGGFTDYNRNGIPDPGEWEGLDGATPKNYFQATNISELPGQLESAFRDIARSISTGTATSASVDTILGGGVSVQTVYYPVYQNPDNSTQQVRWVGSVYGLFVDKFGNLREDSDRNGSLTQVNGATGDKGDYIVTFNSLSVQPDVEPRCYEFGSFISRCYDPVGTNEPTLFTDARRHPRTLHSLNTLFDTGQWLMQLSSQRLATGTRPLASAATKSDGRRRILYGRPQTILRPSPSLGLFNTTVESLAELAPAMLHDNWQDSLPGTATKSAAAKDLVEWITGIEKPNWRTRTVGDPWGDNSTPGVWRLGDIINSKPILVGVPQSYFDTLYGDRSYSQFRAEQADRRQMAYFGANDGMLHAINIGFYGSLKNGQVEFSQSDGVRTSHERGSEVWAFIPTSVLPHLRWLPDPGYNHAYYVDLKPLINDVKIGGEWRTVLLGGLRLGGRPIETPDAAASGGEHFYSEIFALDITDPERDPVLLWRYSSRELGLTVGLPSIVSHDGSWYAIIPTGPVTDTPVPKGQYVPKSYVQFGADSPYEAFSDQKARLIVLDAATGVPADGTTAPGYLTVSEDNSFFGNPFLPMAQQKAVPWTNHALYYGLTVSRNRETCVDSGAVYRLQMVSSDGSPLPVSGWKLKRLFNTGAPVTGAVNSTYDSKMNLWVFFATGRLWNIDDISPCASSNTALCKSNHRHYIYGIKEELTPSGNMTFSDRTSQSSSLMDFSGASVYSGGAVTGLSAQPGLTLAAGGTTTYTQLQAAMGSSASIGYRRALDLGKLAFPTLDNYEMVITQPKFVPLGTGGSLMAFTSFSPRDAGCGDFGDGYLYLVDTFTGLPHPGTRSLFTKAQASDPATSPQGDRVYGGLTTGKGTPTEAFVITSSAGITVSASAPDASTTSVFLNTGGVLKSNLTSWREVLGSGFDIEPHAISHGLE
ncbi:MAG: hypothetical protein LBR80_03795 [Deltaproteobacteria bacterium]|jgi:type IV pilus assembly protein PilY1|nr:hypothetical protein [Deltaproteobacteria bacterium]